MRKLLAPYRFKPVLVILGWGTTLSAVILWGMFQGVLLPRGEGGLLPEQLQAQTWKLTAIYLSIIGLSLLCALILEDLAIALGSFLASYGLAAAITYWALALPGFLGATTESDLLFREVLVKASVNFTFRAFFPFPLFLGLFATVVGAALDEYWFS